MVFKSPNGVISGFYFGMLFLGASNVACGDTAIIPIFIPNTSVQTVRVGNAFYEYNLSGFENYLLDLKNTDSESHQELAPELSRLRSRDTKARVLGVTVVLGGAGMVLAAGVTRGGLEKNPELALGGIGVALLGGVLALVMMPHNSDLMNFINEHNKLKPSNPMTF